MWPFNRVKPHTCMLGVVAFDTGYNTKHADTSHQERHLLRWLRCECGKRSFAEGEGSSHRGVQIAKHFWIEQNEIFITPDGFVFHGDYKLVSKPTDPLRRFTYKPLTDVQQALEALKENPHFQTLYQHQSVADAFGQLEVMVKLHDTVDTP